PRVREAGRRRLERGRRDRAHARGARAGHRRGPPPRRARARGGVPLGPRAHGRGHRQRHADAAPGHRDRHQARVLRLQGEVRQRRERGDRPRAHPRRRRAARPGPRGPGAPRPRLPRHVAHRLRLDRGSDGRPRGEHDPRHDGEQPPPQGRAPAPTLSTRSSRGRAPRTRRRPALRIADPIRLVTGTIALACALSLAWLSFASTPAIATVTVVGARHVRVGQAIAQSGLLEAPTFGASAAEARTRLRGLAAVRDARVEISLPSSARVTLVEREAAGRWIASNGLEWFVDADGVLFPSADPAAAPDLRVTDERGQRTAGERIDPALVAVALRLAKIAPGELRADATAPRVVMTAGAVGLVLRFGSGWEVRFGGPEQFDEKLALAKRYLRDNPQR